MTSSDRSEINKTDNFILREATNSLSWLNARNRKRRKRLVFATNTEIVASLCRRMRNIVQVCQPTKIHFRSFVVRVFIHVKIERSEEKKTAKRNADKRKTRRITLRIICSSYSYSTYIFCSCFSSLSCSFVRFESRLSCSHETSSIVDIFSVSLFFHCHAKKSKRDDCFVRTFHVLVACLLFLFSSVFVCAIGL